MRFWGTVRRVRRLSLINFWSNINRRLRWARNSSKHLKIDDEERNINHSGDSRLPTLISVKMIFLIFFIILLFLVTGLACIIYKPPIIVIKYLQWKYSDVVFHFPLPSSQKFIAMTLDDAPSSETPMILDLLKSYKAKATFFVIGKQISDYPEILHRIYDEGHEIGIHGWADEPSYKLQLIELKHQIKKIEAMLPWEPDRSKWFRPGSGFFTAAMVEMLKPMGYKIALGSIYPHDPQIKYPKVNAAHVLSMIKPGAVIIMHDRRTYSHRQLELVLQGLTIDGWGVQTLSQLEQIGKNITEKRDVEISHYTL